MWSEHENKNWNGTKRLSSGAVYHGDADVANFQSKIFGYFCFSNPLHPDVFPYTRKMESEVISMVIHLFNGKNDFETAQCGLLTSGGTESILMAIRSYKYWALNKKGIKYPELIIPVSAHAAFIKGCEMYNIKPIIIDINPNTYKVETKTVRRYINRNTIAVIASAPQYAQGVLDPISELSELCVKYNIGLHIDCCIGSFLLPILSKIGKNNIPLFDFRLKGVTTISCDTHKFGFSLKGTSVLMYRNNELRNFGYFNHCESSIGLYCTPTIQGSRSGGVIASTWSIMMHMGYQGYINEAKTIMNGIDIIKKGLNTWHAKDKTNKDLLYIMGDPVMSILGFGSKSVNIYCISDSMSAKGWTLNNCKDPSCVHLCLTRANCHKSNKFINDLITSAQDVKNNPSKYGKGGSAMYGALVSIPSPELQNDFMKLYLDIVLSTPKDKDKLLFQSD